ncbi:MAG: NIF family HAD-type phosphatase [Aureispira sp.]
MRYKNKNKTLLILDIDETLLHTTDKKLAQQADFELFGYNVYKRPYLDAFIEAVKDHFLLAIWSSGSDDYVDAIVEQIIPKESHLEFVWGRSRCTYQRNLAIYEQGYSGEDLEDHYHYIKPLKKLKRKGYSLDRILIVDDSPHKSKDNYGNAIYPSAFVGNSTDQELKLLAQYLLLLKDKELVRRIEKRGWRGSVL